MMHVVHLGKEPHFVQDDPMDDIFEKGPDRDPGQTGERGLDPGSRGFPPERRDHERNDNRRINDEVGEIVGKLGALRIGRCYSLIWMRTGRIKGLCKCAFFNGIRGATMIRTRFEIMD